MPNESEQIVGDESQTGPKPGDVVLFEHPKGMAKLITFLTRSPYYHVAIYSGNDNVIEARPQGVVERNQYNPIGGPIGDYISMKPDAGERALAWARARIGDKYDKLGVLVLILERVFRLVRLNYAPPGRFTCGEFVVRAFLETGENLLPDLKPEEVEPRDFALLKPQPVRSG